jgi:hypothetical protein
VDLDSIRPAIVESAMIMRDHGMSTIEELA